VPDLGRVHGINGLGCGRNVYFRGRWISTKVDVTGGLCTFYGTRRWVLNAGCDVKIPRPYRAGKIVGMLRLRAEDRFALLSTPLSMTGVVACYGGVTFPVVSA